MCSIADKIRKQLIHLIVMSLIISGNKIPGWDYTKKRSLGMSKWGKNFMDFRVYYWHLNTSEDVLKSW